jgi:flagellar hook-associated protein 2
MATSSSAIFSGQSSYSADFQQVLTRAVSIASLPMQLMQNTVTTITGQQQELSSLQSAFTTLQVDIAAVATAAQGSATAQSSQPSAVQASTSSGAMSGTYSIEVDTIGSSASAFSQAGVPPVTDPTTGSISTASTFTLTANGKTTTITPTGSSLEDLASAINTSGASAQATVVNVGSNASPDYRLTVSDTNLGPDTIQLNDGTTNLLSPLSAGAYSSYKVNGSTTAIQGTSNQVTLSPGLTAALTQPTTTGTPAVITVSTGYSSLSSALSTLATDYNSAVAALNKDHGQNGGALTGQSIIYNLTNVLQSISQYASSSGSVGSLNDLGLSLDETGNLDFDPTALSSANMASVQQFLGSTTTGGFLKSANDALTAVVDPTSGVIQSEITTDTNQINNQNNLIAEAQTRVNDLQTSLQAQLSAADAAIATLQSQTSYFTALFDATYLNNNNGTSGA